MSAALHVAAFRPDPITDPRAVLYRVWSADDRAYLTRGGFTRQWDEAALFPFDEAADYARRRRPTGTTPFGMVPAWERAL